MLPHFFGFPRVCHISREWAIDSHMIGIMSPSTVLAYLRKMVYWIDLKKGSNACTTIKRDNNIRRTVL